ncbi:GH92 family glycosyl hydrolase [Actinacidiphila acididurans]|uniref:GH92 family glycosyl hydrolase n=1 Tax=Actinacidiphila acididurans TaxID=2784346 RepID=A0ABS2TN46_9ACTN|nr:GH92 family glycosyl hydrolase [Actinacidiphila acididurans]MBM9504421.1 GH92 family glycosyl hydrolase [Actinacidiphila acididurans]
MPPRQGLSPRRRLRTAAVVVVAAGMFAAGGGGAAVARPLALSASAASTGDSLVSDPASLVDPLIGTGSGGATVGQVDTYPGATAPFGMMSFSPDTPSRPDGGGYNYDEATTTGFSLTHMSGPGCGAFGDFPILPTAGALGDDPASTTAAFQHAQEHAAPGSYGVTLNPGTSSAVRAELAATERTGIGRFTYPATSDANVLFKVGAAQSGNQSASIQVVGDRTVTGTETAGQFCGSPGTYPVHFTATFSRPFSSYGTWHTAPTGPNLLTKPTGELPWTYHEVASGGTPASITPATTSDGGSAVAWKQSNALANTWIEATPSGLVQGDTYQASVTLQGTGNVYLNFYNGRQDVGGKAVSLSSTPVTLTVDTAIPTGSIGAPQFQVRTAGAGPVDLLASATSIQQDTVVKSAGTARVSTHGSGTVRVPADRDGKPAGPGTGTPVAPRGVEAKGAQSRTQVAATDGLQSGAWVSFDTTSQPQVTMKVALSYVSQANAAANLEAEDPGWNVDAVAQRTYAQWNSLLSRIRIGGGTADQRQEFYTALYHTMLEPSIFSDAGGDYLGFDDQVHRTAHGGVQYANFSGWDIYRSEIPLLAVVAPRQTGQMMTSLLNDQAQGGWLPKWGFANDYTDVMNGDAADPMLAEAYAMGARGFDAHAALAAMVKGATSIPASPADKGQGWYVERPQLDSYQSLGYIPNTTQSSLSPTNNGASETIEYATADFGIAQLAKALGDTSTYSAFLGRSQNWTNIFNTDTGYIQPRDGNGQFPQFDPTTDGMGDFGQSGFQEGNAAQYTWAIPQNIQGLITGMGGDQAAIARLDTYFQQLNAGPNQPYEWAGNEPAFGTPWIYDYAGAPYKTEDIVHRLLTTVYADSPGGEPGNDDLGSMSSWFVWSSLGMYPTTPGAPVLALGAPIFSRAEFDLPGGHQLKLSAPGASTSTYVHSLSVNGKTWAPAWLPASLLTGADAPAGQPSATELDFTLSPTADTTWASAATDAPPSYPAGPLQFPPGRKPIILTPTGPNLLGDTPTGQLAWQGPVQNGVGSVPGTLAATTTPEGASAVRWTETAAAPNTWIWVDPVSQLPAGQSYQATITLQGTGTVYLDFWNGAQDLTSQTVQLTSTPQTIVVQGAVPSAADTHVQIRTGDTGPVDLYASAASLRLLTPQQN